MHSTTEAKTEPSPRTRPATLPWVGVGLGALAVLGTSATSWFGYASGIDAAFERQTRLCLDQARLLAAVTEQHPNDSDRTVLDQIGAVWSRARAQPAEEHLCVLDAESRLLLHSTRPNHVGRSMATVHLLPTDDPTPRPLAWILNNGKEATGTLQGLDQTGEVVGFVPVANRGWLVGVHASSDSLLLRARQPLQGIAIALALICGVLMPASLALLLVTFRRSENQRRQAERDLWEREAQLRQQAAVTAQEAKVQSLEAHTRAVVECAPDGIITIDVAGIVKGMNPAAEELFGYRADEIVGRNVSMLAPPPYAEEHDGYLQHYLQTGEKRIIGIGREVSGRRKDATVFPMHLRVGELQAAEGRVFIGIMRDISAHKADEEALRDMNAQLVRSNQELDDFAYIASHDLKEPLRGISSYAGFLLEDYAPKLDDDGKRRLLTLQRLSLRMEALIDSLLHYSRVGRVELATTDTDLDEILEDVLESLHISLQERCITVRRPTPLPTVRCDRVRVTEVLRNLIANAIKYNDKPDRWIEVGWRPSAITDPVQANALFYVKDNGIGIASKHFATVFAIFRRLHGRDDYGGGTGVGLSIVRKIVERHGGTIWLESTPGEGTTFLFTLDRGTP